jgi:soluble lytic murein transglycosylase-like protein
VTTWTRQRLAQLVAAAEAKYGIPTGLLARIIAVESGWNPAAVNADKNGTVDRGIAQINSVHTDVTDAQAYNPQFAIPWAAAFLASWRAKCGSWEAAVAAYNLGHCGNDPKYVRAVMGSSAAAASSAPSSAPEAPPTWLWIGAAAVAAAGLFALIG